MATKKNSDFEKIAHLLPLRISGDLSVDETKVVDEAARYDERTQKELDAFQKTHSVLQEAASLPVPNESPVCRGENGASLWDRIEPRLGPAGRMRERGGFQRIPTSYLVAACLGLFCLTLANESQQWVGRRGQVLDNGSNVGFGTVPVGNNPAQSGIPINGNGERVSVTVKVDAKALQAYLASFAEPTIIREAGIEVARINIVTQRQFGLKDQNGVIVSKVFPGFLGEHAGLKPGDCILAINGQSVYAPKHVQEVVTEQLPEGELRFDIVRRGESAAKSAKVGDEQSSLVPSTLPALPDSILDFLRPAAPKTSDAEIATAG